MRDHVRFHSDEFTPADVEPGQINTERYGFALATWVAARLSERGFEVGAPTPEDWGWFLGVKSDGQTVHIGCGNVDGSIADWLIWTEAEKPSVLSRLFKRAEPAPNALYGVVAALHGALGANESVDDIEWFRVGSRGEELDPGSTPI